VKVSNPDSPYYRKFLTVEKINSIVAAPVEDRQMIKDWLFKFGVSKVEDRGDSLKFIATIQQLESLFQTKMYTFTNKKTGSEVVRQAGDISIPQEFSSKIFTVTGIADFPVPKKEKRTKSGPQDDNKPVVVPYVLENQYGFPYTYVTFPNSSIGLIEFQDNPGFPLLICNTSNKKMTCLKFQLLTLSDLITTPVPAVNLHWMFSMVRLLPSMPQFGSGPTLVGCLNLPMTL